MPFKEGQIRGVIIRALARHRDSRGWLTELFRSDEVDPSFTPAMAYVSSTEPGEVRGPHEHSEQSDFFCFVGPSTFRLYLWDTRKGSESFGVRMVLEVGELQPTMILIPAGVVHAYKNIGSAPGWSINLPDRLYAGPGRKESVDEIRHENDPNSIFRMDE